MSRSSSSRSTSNSDWRLVTRAEKVVPLTMSSHARVATSFIPKYVPDPRCRRTASPSSTRDRTSGGQVSRSAGDKSICMISYHTARGKGGSARPRAHG